MDGRELTKHLTRSEKFRSIVLRSAWICSSMVRGDAQEETTNDSLNAL